jgi:hypothetical protein
MSSENVPPDRGPSDVLGATQRAVPAVPPMRRAPNVITIVQTIAEAALILDLRVIAPRLKRRRLSRREPVRCDGR